MFKKYFSTTLILGALIFLAGSASAQLQFFNGSSCTINVKAAAENVNFPCSNNTCGDGTTVTIAPGTSAVIPVGPCFFPVSQQGYRATKFEMTGGITAYVDKCLGPNPAFFVDCQGNPRQLQIFNPTFAAIF